MPTVFVNRSTDDGVTWSSPVQMPPPAAKRVDLDQNWTVCDNNSSSPFFGHCYTELDNFGQGDLELMSTSTDGGATWSLPIPTVGNDKGLGGQPLVQPDGVVVVPSEGSTARLPPSARPTAARRGRRDLAVSSDYVSRVRGIAPNPIRPGPT